MRQETAVPGGTLGLGAYTIEIIDHLSDRSVVRITSQSKPLTVTFLGVGASDMSLRTQDGPIFWNKGLHGETSLRGFSFPSGERLEFVYPKGDAVVLANANKESVVAVDPTSEKRPELSKLSPADLELVTLWSLTPVSVGPASASVKGIEAKRFVADRNLSNQPYASSPAFASLSPHRTTTQQVLLGKIQKPLPAMKADHVDSYVNRLPQTAGYAALVGVLAILSFCGALCIRLRGAVWG